MIIPLPPNLEAAVAEALRTLPSSQWMRAARSLSERYRADRDDAQAHKPLARGDVAALGYAGMMLPAAYAQLAGAMRATAERVSDWQPASMLDIGSGPGTALWAAVEQWPSLGSLTAWEREPAFIALGRRLANASDSPAVREARWQQVKLGRQSPVASSQLLETNGSKLTTDHWSLTTEQYDLVVLGHVLNELSEPLQREVVAFAWERCKGALLIVEPGTSAAFPVVKAAREQLMALGAYTLAPCAHDQPCPLTGDWCHFPQKLHRPEYQRRVKGGSAGWEESKFSYAAMARFPPSAPIWGRLIHQPHKSKVGVELTVSSREGIVKPRVSKRNKALFKELSDLHWGDTLEEPINNQTKITE